MKPFFNFLPKNLLFFKLLINNQENLNLYGCYNDALIEFYCLVILNHYNFVSL